MKRNTLLYAVTPPEGVTSHIFGTMHVRDDRVYQLASAVLPLIENCDVYLAEMDLNPTEDSPGASPVYHLDQYIRPHVYARARKQLLKSFSVDLDLYRHLHPLLILSLLTEQVYAAEHQRALDEFLWRFAAEADKEMGGLESFREQYEILHSLDPVPVAQQIVRISRSPNSIRRYARKAMEHYVNADIAILYRMTRSSMRHLRNIIVDQRNIQMALRIDTLDRSKTHFIALGVGHLPGKQGILRCLKKKGWKIRPVISSVD